MRAVGGAPMARSSWFVSCWLPAASALAWLVPAGSSFAAGGTISDQAGTLVYPATLWASLPYTRFTGTEPVPGTSIVYQSGWWYRVNGVDTREYPLPAPS